MHFVKNNSKLITGLNIKYRTMNVQKKTSKKNTFITWVRQRLLSCDTKNVSIKKMRNLAPAGVAQYICPWVVG